MTSLPLDSTHRRQRRAWHSITALGHHTRSDDVGLGIKSRHLDSTHGRTTSDVACHHLLYAACTIERRQAQNDITAFGQHTRSNDVGRGMTSPLLDNTHGRMTSAVACHHRPLTTHTVGRRPAWHDLTALGQHTRSDYVGRGMTSPPLDGTLGRMTLGVA